MATTKYAYSLTGDRHDYTGGFATRREARAAGMEALKQLSNPPSTVYVARVSPADPQTTGHARTVLREMTRRGDASGVSNYLAGLKVDQVADLDKELSAAILNWLLKHHLEPKAFKVDAVSEYPVPLVPEVQSGPTNEVHDLGTDNLQ
jgi:hypothetical protein